MDNVEEFWRLMKQLRDTYPDIYKIIAYLIWDIWGMEDPIVIAIVKQMLWDEVEKQVTWSGEAIDLIRKILSIRPPDPINVKIPPDPFKPRPGSPPITLGGLLEAGAVAALPVVTIAAPLALSAHKLGKLSVDLDFWATDPCEEKFKALSDAWADHRAARRGYPTGTSVRSTMQLLEDARELVIYAQLFLRDCPNYRGAALVRNTILKQAMGWRDEYLDYLAAH